VRYAPNRYCYQVLVTGDQIELLVPHLECQLTRMRMINPPGVSVEAHVLVSFHDEFVTKGDRLYALRCLHTHSSGNQTESPLVPANSNPVTDTPTPPLECSYEVVRKAHGNPSFRPLLPDERLPVGTALLHRWGCRHHRPSHCLIVTGCLLRTDDTEHELVDEYGCSTVPALVGELEYDGSVSYPRSLKEENQ
jgi:hypothetical protein